MSESIAIELLGNEAVQLVVDEDDSQSVELLVGATPTVEVVETKEFIEISEQGPTGNPGVSGSAASSFVFTQSTPAASWTIFHNRGTKPDIVLTLASNPAERVYTDVTYPDLNTAVAVWPSPESGSAYIS